MKVHQAFRFALDPSPHAERALSSHVGARRFAFNWGLALVKERLEARRRAEGVEVPWTLPALRREWNRAKETVAPWWRENSKGAYSSGLAGLLDALKNWSSSRKDRRKGRRMGFPRFRKKGRGRESVCFTTGAIRVRTPPLRRSGASSCTRPCGTGRALWRRTGSGRAAGRARGCGAVKESLLLWERTFRCDACGLVLDRDENAARNLAALAVVVAASGPETENARGRDGRPAKKQAVPEEAGSRQRECD